MALAVVLSICAALLIRSFLSLRQVNPGFDAHHVLTMRMSLTGPQFDKPEAVTRVIREGVRQIRALPGVEVAATSCCVPLEDRLHGAFQIAGRPEGPASGGLTGWTLVSPGYFETLKIPVLGGRAFREEDESGPPVVMINQTLAKRFWPDSDPLKDEIMIGDQAPRQVIGVVGEVREEALNRAPRPNLYLLAAQMTDTGLMTTEPWAWLIRTGVAPLSLSSAIQKQLREGERRPAGSPHSHDGGNRIAIHGGRELQHRGAHDFWVLGAAAGGDWNLRTDGILGGPARPGNWSPAGFGRRIQPHPEYGGVSGPAAGSGRCGLRLGSGFRVDPLDRQLSVWCEGVGSPGLFCGSAHIGRCSVGCCMLAGAASKQGRPHRRAAVRMIRARIDIKIFSGIGLLT
jgi:hypothetical protein